MIKSVQMYWTHVRNIHAGDQSFTQCDKCKENFKSVRNIRIHIRKVHKTEYQNFRCDACRFGTDSHISLTNHKIAKVSIILE